MGILFSIFYSEAGCAMSGGSIAENNESNFSQMSLTDAMRCVLPANDILYFAATIEGHAHEIPQLLRYNADPFAQVSPFGVTETYIPIVEATAESLSVFLEEDITIPGSIHGYSLLQWRLIKKEDDNQVLLKIAQKRGKKKALQDLNDPRLCSYTPIREKIERLRSFFAEHL